MGKIITMGEVRKPIAVEGRALIDDAINLGCDKGYQDFWVVLRAHVDPFVSQQQGAHAVFSKAIIITPEKYKELRSGAPEFKGWLDSVCVHIVKGDMVEVITRPKDIPTDGIEMSEDTSENVSQTAQDLGSALAY